MSLIKKLKKSIAPALGGAGAGALIGSAVPGIGTLVGAGLGAAAGVGLSAMQDSQVNAQNKANKKAVDRANAYDMYAWDVANQYNNPKAQVQRLIDAGFNPYTQGAVSAGNASGVPSSNGVAETAVADKVGLGMRLAQQGMNLATSRQQLQNMKMTEELDRIKAVNAPKQIAYQIASQSINNDIARHNLQYAKDHKRPVGFAPTMTSDPFGTAFDAGSVLFDLFH